MGKKIFHGFQASRLLRRACLGISLKTRVGIVLTTLVALFTLILGASWAQATRASIHEEVEAATRVSEQWLHAMALEIERSGREGASARVLEMVRLVGRVRANRLELHAADGSVRHVSPPPTYKAGREAPEWFARLLTEDVPSRHIDVAGQRLVLYPDASRAILDAWDDLLAMTGWAVLLLVTLFSATRLALARALLPLDQLMQALARTGAGRFDARLPGFRDSEMGLLSSAFNGMADRLQQAVDENVRLETEREVTQQFQQRVESERRWIARELHDELAQCVTAVRALAGAIVQRTAEQPALHGHAQSIVAVTGEMQEGVRNILERLRPPAATSLRDQLRGLIEVWRSRHGEIELECHLSLVKTPIPDDVALTVLRAIQEGLTNVIRHAAATRVSLAVKQNHVGLEISLVDNGRGKSATNFAGSGLGLAGMRERVNAAGGELRTWQPVEGGFALEVSLPLPLEQTRLKETQ